MGGTSVASANNDNAQFYNSALLAFNHEIEERTQDSRFWFPLLVPQVSDSAITAEHLLQKFDRSSISNAVQVFNDTQDMQSAQDLARTFSRLDSYLRQLADEDLTSDVYIGTAVSEPGRFQGAGFFFGARVLGGGVTAVSGADRATLAAYEEGLAFVASGGTEGAPHPELFDANGALISPAGGFDSTMAAAGVVVVEAGVAMSGQFHPFGRSLAAGLTFKVQSLYTFEDSESVIENRIDVGRNSDYQGDLNFDLGIAKDLGDHWRVGLAAKDIIPHNYVTSLGTVIRMRPHARLGVAYRADRFQLAADADLNKNEPIGFEGPTQELAIGGEWTVSEPVRLRAGYRYDLQGNRAGIVSLGAGALWGRFALDLAYATGRDTRAMALQAGYAF